MASTTVRIDAADKEILRHLSAETGRKMQELLSEAVELYRRTSFLRRANAAFAGLKSDPDAWAAETEERAAWETTLSDGLGA
jgi:hypothetical protein